LTQPNNTSASTSNAQVNFIKEKKTKKKKLLPNTPAKFKHPRSNKNNKGCGKGRGRGSAVKSCTYCKLNGHTYDTCWTLQGDKQSGRFSSRARMARSTFRYQPYQSIQSVGQNQQAQQNPQTNLTYNTGSSKPIPITDKFGFISMFAHSHSAVPVKNINKNAMQA